MKKIVGTTTTRYISKLYECDTTGANTTCSRYIWANDTRIATVATNGTTHYWHGDHLGSSSVITDSTGAKVQALTYYPYGDLRTNQSFTTPAINVPYKFTGKELDASSNLYFYEARYYHAVFGRFIAPDPIVPNLYDPQDLNRYTYAGNNPLRYTDPTGHFKIGKFFSRLFHKADRFFAQNTWARALGWAFAPPLMMHVDFATRDRVVAAGAGFAVGGPIGGFYGAVAGGGAAGFTSAALNDGNLLRGAGIGALAGAVGYGAGWVGGGLINPNSGSYLAQIGKGGVVGALKGASVSLATNLAEGKIDTNGLWRSAAIGAALGAARPIAVGRDVTDLPSRQQNISYWGQEWGKDFSGVTVREGGLLNAGLQLTGHGGIALGGMINLETGGGVLRGLMGHELWHVVQAQERGLVLFQAGYVFNSNYYEMEADTMSRTHYGTQGIP